MAMYTGFQHGKRLAGVAALSGYLPHYAKFKEYLNEANKVTPALLMHGEVDGTVQLKFGAFLRRPYLILGTSSMATCRSTPSRRSH